MGKVFHVEGVFTETKIEKTLWRHILNISDKFEVWLYYTGLRSLVLKRKLKQQIAFIDDIQLWFFFATLLLICTEERAKLVYVLMKQ